MAQSVGAGDIREVGESLVRAQPWIALSLMDAFQEAKTIAMRRVRNQSLLVFNQHYAQAERALFGDGNRIVFGGRDATPFEPGHEIPFPVRIDQHREEMPG